MFYNDSFDILLTTILRNIPVNAVIPTSLVIKAVFDKLGVGFFGKESNSRTIICRSINVLLYNKIIYKFNNIAENNTTDNNLSRSIHGGLDLQFDRFTI